MKLNAVYNLIDFILPRNCFHCDKLLSPQEKCLCFDCRSSIKRTDSALLENEYRRKFAESCIDSFYSPFVFEKDSPLQSLIHNLKYSSQFTIGKYLGRQLYFYGINVLDEWQAQAIVPVPLHHLKKATRGYNQAEFIAKGLAKLANIKIINPLKRKKYTETQTQLTAEERRENIRGAFELKKYPRLFDSVIILDDVITTGSTINEAARILKSAGMEKIFALSLAVPAIREVN